MTKFLKKTLIRNKFKSNIISKNTKKLKGNKSNIDNKPEKEINKSQEMEIGSIEEIENISKKNFINLEQKNKKKISDNNSNKPNKKNKQVQIIPQLSMESIKEHYYTFNLVPELYTILYTTLIFKWIQTDRV